MSDGNRHDGIGVRRVLAIPGSIRRESYNRRLLSTAINEAPPGMVVSLYDRIGEIPFFDEDVERASGGGPEMVREFREDVARADALLIATPEYNSSIPGVLKNAIDWLSRPSPMNVLSGKPIAVIGASVGRGGTRVAQHHLRQVFVATESLVVPSPALYVGNADEMFRLDGTLATAAVREVLGAVLRALAHWIEVTAAPARSPADGGVIDLPSGIR